MLFHAGAKTEVRSFGIEEHSADLAAFDMFRQCQIECAYHGSIDKIGLGATQPKPQEPALFFEPDFDGLRHNYVLARG
jgi:hypothetical protein